MQMTLPWVCSAFYLRFFREVLNSGTKIRRFFPSKLPKKTATKFFWIGNDTPSPLWKFSENSSVLVGPGVPKAPLGHSRQTDWHGIVWYCAVLNFIAWYCTLFHGIALKSRVLHWCTMYNGWAGELPRSAYGHFVIVTITNHHQSPYRYCPCSTPHDHHRYINSLHSIHIHTVNSILKSTVLQFLKYHKCRGSDISLSQRKGQSCKIPIIPAQEKGVKDKNKHKERG